MADEGPSVIHLKEGDTVDKWLVTKKLGEGTFGAVYLVKDDKDNLCAMKSESVEEKHPLLAMEAKVMMDMARCRARHLAQLEDKGKFGNFNYIVMKLVGKSLQDVKKTGPEQHMSLGPAMSVGIQCLEALEDMHTAGYLHRDVKPGNFCVGRSEVGELRKVFVLDFGMARKFVSDNGVIRKPRAAALFRGTPRYAPIASHDKKEHSRREDVESWFYMLVDFTNAKLPWKGAADINAVGQCKKDSRNASEIPKFFVGCPKEYITILRMVDAISYYESPPYQKIYGMLRKAIGDYRCPEFPYDWEPKEGASESGESKGGGGGGTNTVKTAAVKGWTKAGASKIE